MNLVQECLCPAKRERLDSFPPLPNTGFPLVNYLHEEAVCCLEAGLDQAALMTASVLLEATFRILVTLQDAGTGTPILHAMKKWNKVSMGPLIDELGRRQIVGKELLSELHERRKSIRNVFQHGNTPLLDPDSLDRDEYTDKTAMMAFVFGQPFALMHETRRLSFEWFLFVHRTIRNQIPWDQISATFKGKIESPTSEGPVVFGYGASGVLSKPRSIWGRPISEGKSSDQEHDTGE